MEHSQQQPSQYHQNLPFLRFPAPNTTIRQVIW